MLESVAIKSGGKRHLSNKNSVQSAASSPQSESKFFPDFTAPHRAFYATTSRIWGQRKLDLLQFRMPKRTSGGGAKFLGLRMGLSLAT